MDKNLFVKQFLKPTLMAADKTISDVTYMKSAAGEEYVTVKYHTGDVSRATVTGDSCVALIKDVLEVL